MNKELLDLVNANSDNFRLNSYQDDMMEELFNDLGGFDYDLLGKKLSTAYLISWTCTDTLVGLFAYKLEDELICFSIQQFRKGGIQFYWVSSEARNKTINFFNSCRLNNEDLFNSVNEIEESMLTQLKKLQLDNFNRY
jgi:hypothetical protein